MGNAQNWSFLPQRPDYSLDLGGFCQSKLTRSSSQFPVFSTSYQKPLMYTEISLTCLNIHCKYTVWNAHTCNESVLDVEAKAFQLLIAGELDPHETSCWCNQARVLSPTEAINEWWEPKRPITDFDVIEAAFEWWLDVVILIKSELNPLPGKSFSEQGSGGEREREQRG